jgi:hypothetical protein
MKPTIVLALEDYIPVLIALVSFFWVSQTAGSLEKRNGYLAKLGLVLIAVAGLLKATEKLIWVITDLQTPWMRNSLFILNGFGFTCFAWAIWSGRKSSKGQANSSSVWIIPTLICLVAGGLISYAAMSLPGRTWFFISLAFASVANIITISLLISLSLRFKLPATAALFAAYLVAVFALVGLSRAPSPTVNDEWVKQAMNTVAAVLLALATWRLRNTVSKEGVRSF